MKKLLFTLVAVVGFIGATQAQSISENALGLRLGDSDGFGAEISYQRALASNNRLEFDLGWRDGNHYDAFKLTGLYQWVWNIDGGFNWYAGAGAGVGSWSYDSDYNDHNDDDGVFAAIDGNLGIEYNFDIPLLISLDFRPEFGINDYDDNVDFDIALGIRYQF
ncbi:hypothetical protein ACG2LH_13010 [Zhouia sp. PK063]|uniref:hypothetical protein n=1 Tax=Zhouia sp. PK063 TaxID=3373602 RepID=UPI00378A0E16